MAYKGKLKKKNQKVNEPSVNYDSEQMKITIFNSFEEMNEADAKEMASNSPIENVKAVTARIKQIYASKLKDKMTDLTIHIKKSGLYQ